MLRRVHGVQRWGAVFFAVITLGALVVLASPGGAVTGSTFESSDGNLVVNAAGNKDWANAPSLVRQADKASGTNDDAFGQGAKEDIPNPSVVSGSIPPNKSDLTQFYASHEVVSGNTFLYLGWERSNILGNANMDFEFNQSKVLTSNGVTPARTASVSYSEAVAKSTPWSAGANAPGTQTRSSESAAPSNTRTRSNSNTTGCGGRGRPPPASCAHLFVP